MTAKSNLCFLASLLFGVANAHLVTVCTSTSPSVPGVAALWFGNYHYLYELQSDPNVDGYVKFTSPEGVTRSFPWNTFCEGSSYYSSSDVTVFASDLKSTQKSKPCTDLQDSYGRPLMTQDSTVNCYVYNTATGTHEFAAVGQNLACPSGGQPMPNIVATWFVVPVTDLSSGYYRIEASTSHIFISPLYDYPCAITSGPSFASSFPIVFYGSGSSCTSAPGDELTQNVDPSTLATCDGTQYTITSGFVCPAKCVEGYTATDLLSCVNGAWNPSFKCTAVPTCGGISQSNNRDGTVPNGAQGVTGENCNAFTEAGVTCDLVCDEDNEAYGSVRCGNDGLWTNVNAYCSPKPSSIPTPSSSLSPSPAPVSRTCADSDSSLTCDLLFYNNQESSVKLCSHKLHDGRLIRDVCPQSCNCCSINGQCMCNQDDQVTAYAQAYGYGYDVTCQDAVNALGGCDDQRFARKLRMYCPCLCGAQYA